MGRLILCIVGIIFGTLFSIAAFNPYDPGDKERYLIIGIAFLAICGFFLLRRVIQSIQADLRAGISYSSPPAKEQQHAVPPPQSTVTGSLFVPPALPKRPPHKQDER